MTNQNLIAFIPARAGSKRFPNKNKYPLWGKPLFAHSVEAARTSKIFNEIIVSSDDDEILAYCLRNKINYQERPLELAGDNITNAEVLRNYLTRLEIKNESSVCLLQPTSPLRKASHICEAYDIFTNHEAKCSVVSMRRSKIHLSKYYVRSKSKTVTRLKEHLSDSIDLFEPNGAIYFCPASCLIKNNSFLCKNVLIYEMNSIDSIDIDLKEDILQVETLNAYND